MHNPRARVQALTVLAVSCGLWLLAWCAPGAHTVPDSRQYARMTARDAGLAHPDQVAAAWWCARTQPGSRDRCMAALAAHPDPGPYRAIFDARPGWPRLAAALVPVLGLGGALVALTAFAGVFAGLAVYAGVREAGGGHRAGLAGAVALYVLPSGRWLTELLPEGMVLALLAVAAVAAHRLLEGRRGACLLVAALGLLYVVKSPNAAVAAAALGLVAAAAGVAGQGRGRDAAVTVAVVVTGMSAAWYGWAAWRGYPGLHASLVDLATWHFTHRAHGGLWHILWRRNMLFGVPYLWAVLTAPWPLAVVGAGGVALWRVRRCAAAVWLALGCSAVALCVAHPITDNWARLAAPVWLPAAVGLALVPAAVRRHAAPTRCPHPQEPIPLR